MRFQTNLLISKLKKFGHGWVVSREQVFRTQFPALEMVVDTHKKNWAILCHVNHETCATEYTFIVSHLIWQTSFLSIPHLNYILFSFHIECNNVFLSIAVQIEYLLHEVSVSIDIAYYIIVFYGQRRLPEEWHDLFTNL